MALKGKKVTSISCGAEHSALIADGTLYTWGFADAGRLGHGNEKNQNTPTVVEFFDGKKPKEVVCGSDWTTVLTEDGSVYTFGYGANGRLGVGTDANQLSPKKVDLNGKKVKFVACGHDHTILLTTTGEVFSYGYGGNGRLGNGTEQDEKSPR